MGFFKTLKDMFIWNILTTKKKLKMYKLFKNSWPELQKILKKADVYAVMQISVCLEVKKNIISHNANI